MRTWSLTTACAAETRALGETLGALLTEHLIVGLWGDLGTGKTCLTQGLARGLGVPVEEPVTSPSYTLMNHYSGRLELHHFDLYRLAGPEDLVDLGFDEYLQGGGVVVVEWAERAPGIETEGLSIRLAHAGEEERRIDFVAEGRVAEALLARLAATLTTERGGRMKEFDIAVIGGGPGGYVAALRAAQQGACVCLIEEDQVGGTCLNRGCIPTKALYATAHLLQRLRGADKHGIGVGTIDFDFAVAARRKDEVVAKLVGGIEQLLKGREVEIFRGRASIEGAGRVCIRSRGVVGHIQARTIILATGSLPARPKTLAIDGKKVLTSNEILAIKELPESLLIVGGGYIGCEFASIFSALGTRVTLVEQLPGLLVQSDRQIVRDVEKTLREQGVAIHTEKSVESLDTSGDGVRVRIEGGEEVLVARVLVAVGRVPNSSGLGLEELGVRLDKGAVVVDAAMRTSVEGLYAIGDVTGGIQLAHVASYQAGIAVTNALGGEARADYRTVPSTIFTLPEIGQVGITEEEARKKGLNVSVGRFAYQASSKALCDGEVRGSVKIVADGDSGKILGAAIVGEEASALIAEVAVAMNQGMTAGELGRVIHSHPTLPEMIMEAAEDVEGMAVHKIGRRTKTE